MGIKWFACQTLPSLKRLNKGQDARRWPSNPFSNSISIIGCFEIGFSGSRIPNSDPLIRDRIFWTILKNLEIPKIWGIGIYFFKVSSNPQDCRPRGNLGIFPGFRDFTNFRNFRIFPIASLASFFYRIMIRKSENSKIPKFQRVQIRVFLSIFFFFVWKKLINWIHIYYNDGILL